MRVVRAFTYLLIMGMAGPALVAGQVLPCEVQKLGASDATAGDAFGVKVSVDGDVAIFGAWGNDDAGTSSGTAYVFRYDGGTWVQEEKLTASDTAMTDKFGLAVSICGDLALVGAVGNDDAGQSSGSAYVFRFDGDTWNEDQKLTASDAEAGDEFGWSVSVCGDIAVVGAIWNDTDGFNAGATYVFRYNGVLWTEEQRLTPSDVGAVDQNGAAVSVDGDVLVVGASGDDDGGFNAGAVYVYRFDGDKWVQEQKLTASDAAANDAFGSAVSLSGDVAIVGSRSDGDAGTSSGAAYMFRYDGGAWVEEQKLIPSDAAAYDFWGSFVSVSGDVAAMGAPRDDDGCAEKNCETGSALVFRYDGSSWVEEQKLTASDAAAGDGFASVAVSGDVALVGAAKDDDGGDGSGSVYVFVLGPESDLDGVIDECDNCPTAFNPEQDDCNDDGVGDACISAGDFNGDGVVDVIDFVDFLDCFGGIDAAPNPDEPACVDACLSAFDFDNDGDVDWMDAASFQIAVTP